MTKGNHKSFIIVITYLLLLRVALYISSGISIFNFGLLFDMLLSMFIIGFFASIIKHKVSQKVYYIIIIVFFSVILIADVVYMEYFHVVTSRANLFGISRLSEGNTTEYDLNIPSIVYMILPFTLLSCFWIIKNKKLDLFSKRNFGIISLLFILLAGLAFLSSNYNFNTKDEYYKSDVYLFKSMHDSNLFSEKYGYFNYHILDLVRPFSKIDNIDEAYDNINDYFNDKEDHIVNEYSDLYAGYNIVTIVGETLETRFIDPILTPNLYMMTHDGYTFDNFFTPVFQQGATCNSEFMSLTGISAIQSNYSINNVCDSYYENTFTYALPNQLKSIGYNTYYFHSGYEWFYNRNLLNPQYGFSTSKFQEDMYELGYDDFDDRFDSQMLQFLQEYVAYDQPFYIEFLSYSGHGAYNQEEFDIHSDRIEEAYPNKELDPEIINYMEKLVEFDNMIGFIMEELTLNGLMDNTLFVVYPDHYPYMFNQEMYSEYIGIDSGTHEIMRQELIMYANNMSGEVISMTGATIDIAPSILNLIDSSLNFKYFIGKDLFSNEDNYVIFSDLTITDGENYLLHNGDYTGLSSEMAILDNVLKDKIRELELQKQLLMIDYFKKLKDTEE